MRIYIEGPSGAGKTTLALHLVRHYIEAGAADVRYFHGRSPYVAPAPRAAVQIIDRGPLTSLALGEYDARTTLRKLAGGVVVLLPARETPEFDPTRAATWAPLDYRLPYITDAPAPPWCIALMETLKAASVEAEVTYIGEEHAHA